MGPKKKGKEKKVKALVEEPKKLTRSQYVAMIADMNKVLAETRQKTAGVETTFFTAEKKFQQRKEDIADVILYLENEIKEKEAEIEDFDVKINILTKERKQQGKEFDEIITKVEEEQKAVKSKLTEQVDYVSAKINALEEVRVQREEFLKKQQGLMEALQLQEDHQREEMYTSEKQAIIEQDTMRKDMERKVKRLTFDFQEATDVRIGVATNRILQDNIQLGNKLTCMQEMMARMRKCYESMKNMGKKSQCKLELSGEEYEAVLRKNVAYVKKIEALLRRHDELKENLKELSNMIKTNRILQRKIDETECQHEYISGEMESLIKALEEKETIFEAAGEHLYRLRRNVVKLETTLCEAAKKVKQAIDVEETFCEAKGKGKEITKQQPSMPDKQDLINQLRDQFTEDILQILEKGALTEEEKQLMAYSTESYELVSSAQSSGTSMKRAK